jgi:hypothetical protein
VSRPDPFDEEDDDLGLEPQGPKEMLNGELADALDEVATGRRAPEPSLLTEAAARLRTHLHLRSALLWRVEQVERLEAELAKLRGERTDEDVAAVARWRRRAVAPRARRQTAVTPATCALREPTWTENSRYSFRRAELCRRRR